MFGFGVKMKAPGNSKIILHIKFQQDIFTFTKTTQFFKDDKITKIIMLCCNVSLSHTHECTPVVIWSIKGVSISSKDTLRLEAVGIYLSFEIV